MDALHRVAAAHSLPVIEDACQAQGSRCQSRLAGTLGLAGCFSLKDGKLASCEEGGYLLTSDPHLGPAQRPSATTGPRQEPARPPGPGSA